MLEQYYQRTNKYFAKNPLFNSFIHIFAGLGAGFILARPLAGTHPVRFGTALIAISIFGHLLAGKK